MVHKKQDITQSVVTLSNVNQFSHFCTVGKRIKFSTKRIWYFPPYLNTGPTLPYKNKIKIKVIIDYVMSCFYGPRCTLASMAHLFRLEFSAAQ